MKLIYFSSNGGNYVKINHSKQLHITKPSLQERYEIAVFLFLFFEFIFMVSEKYLDRFVLTHYAFTYQFGLIPRALIGSLISLFSNKVTSQAVYIMSIIAFMTLISQISIALGRLIRKSDSDIKPALKIFAVLFLASPLSVTYMLGGYFARLDMYWLIITLVSLFCLKNRILRWAIPLLCAAAVMIHQGYLFTYMPALLIPVFYEIYKSRYSKKSIIIFGLSCVSMLCILIFFTFAQKNLPYDNAADFVKQIAKNVDFIPDQQMVYLEYYCPFPQWQIHVVYPLLAYLALPVGLTLLTFSIPLIIIFGSIWKQCLRETDNKFLKFIFLLCALAPSLFVLVAALGTDWDRWWAAVINNQFIIIFYFIFSKEKSVIDAIREVGDFFNEHLLMLALLLIFSNSLTFSKASALVLSIAYQNADVFEALMSYVA